MKDIPIVFGTLVKQARESDIAKDTFFLDQRTQPCVSASRRTGVTSEQMREAPESAVFLWAGPLDYPRRLAAELGRTDLAIHGPNFLLQRKWRGMSSLQVVYDHAFWDVARPSAALSAAAAELYARLRKLNG